jgi:hypothetical protein
VVANGSATGQAASVTSSSFDPKPNTTYLVFVYNSLHSSSNTTTASFSSTFNGSPTFSDIGAGSKGYNFGANGLFANYEFGAWVTSGASPGTGKTITATFTNGNTDQAFLHVVELCGNDTSAPIAQSAYNSSPSNTNTSPYDATLPPAVFSTDFNVYFLDANENLGNTTPVGTPAATNLRYDHVGAGTAGTYFREPPPAPSGSESFAGSNHHWGTIAVEIKRP